MKVCALDAENHGVKLTAKRKKLLQSELCTTREDAAPVLKKIHKPGLVQVQLVSGIKISTMLHQTDVPVWVIPGPIPIRGCRKSPSAIDCGAKME